MYQTTYDICNSPGLKSRMIACAAQEGIANPIAWVDQHVWGMVPLMLTPNGEPWWQVWEYAESTKTINHQPDTGARTDTILDPWIQTVVLTRIANLEAEASGGGQP